MAEENEIVAPAESEEKPRRGRPRRSTKTTITEQEAAAPAAAEATAEEAPAPKRRGRPRKNPLPEEQATAQQDADARGQQAESQDQPAEEAPAPKRRGRPRKADAEAAKASAAEADQAKPAAESKQAAEQKPAAEPKAEAEDSAKQEGRRQRQSAEQRQNAASQRQNRQNGRHNRRDRRDREVTPSVTMEDLAGLKVAELRERAAELEIDVTGLKKAELVAAVFAASVKAEGFLEVEGVLDILSDGYGFLRTSGYLPGESDCYVGTSLIKRNGLRKGDYIKGTTRPARANEKFAAVQKISTVNGIPLEELGTRPRFADLTPIYPCDRLLMEHGKNTVTARVIDLVAPIGKGQRGLIVSPPKAGKTTILKDIAASISANNPEVHLMCLLVDERPEEVTDMQRSIKGEVVSSTFDMPADNHIAVAEMVIERAKRLVEIGEDVVILLDSITRLARAYNLAQPASGRVLSGGVDSTALYPPKRFLGAARNIENGGSLTILASALIETGSKMDEVIFEEFKGTGNMELRLDRQLADRRIFPAIDPVASGTRKEELLLDTQMAPLIWAVRRLLANMNNTERAMDMLIKSIKQTDDNQEFLMRTARKAQHSKTETFEF